MRDALAAVGVPAVLSGTASVFGTPAAREWLTLLHALEQPRPIRIRDAALTCFLGRTVAELCGADGNGADGNSADADALLDELGATLRRWAAVLHGKGVAALLEAVTTGTGLPGRLLGVADGERRLTDVRHVGQALHAAAVDAHLGPAALVEWLRHRIDEAAADMGLERSRRLDSDAAAVQIITVHRSKGLEFPVVYVPFGWDRYVPREPDVPLLHDDAGTRVLDVGGAGGPSWSEHCARHEAEEAGEDLRLLYVALTRARCQVVAWWVPATTTPHLAAAPAAVRATRSGGDAAGVLSGPERHRGADGAARPGGRRSGGRAGARPAAGVVHHGRGCAGGAGGGAVHPDARPGVAAHVVQRADGRGRTAVTPVW